MSARPSVLRTYGARKRVRAEPSSPVREASLENKENVQVEAGRMGLKGFQHARNVPSSPPSSSLPSLTFSSSPPRLASSSGVQPTTPPGASPRRGASLPLGALGFSSPPSSPSRGFKRSLDVMARENEAITAVPSRGPCPLQSSSVTRALASNTGAGSKVIKTATSTAATNRKPLRQLHLVPVRRLPPATAPSSSTKVTQSTPFAPAASRPTSTPSSLYTTCPACSMTYVRGGLGEEDEVLHRRHCARVAAGVVWGGGAEKGNEVLREVRWGEKGKMGAGRVVDLSGTAVAQNRKLAQVLEMVDTVLSSPPLPDHILAKCKIFLLITSSSPPAAPSAKRPRPAPGPAAADLKKERVVGCVVAQEIQWAMEVVERVAEDMAVGIKPNQADYVVVDPAGANGSADLGVMCHPSRLPTRLGIHRLFTLPAYRGHGLARAMLDAACSHTVYGHTCDPRKGEVAFSQPTGAGRAVMQAWGGGEVRVFVEDEQD